MTRNNSDWKGDECINHNNIIVLGGGSILYILLQSVTLDVIYRLNNTSILIMDMPILELKLHINPKKIFDTTLNWT